MIAAALGASLASQLVQSLTSKTGPQGAAGSGTRFTEPGTEQPEAAQETAARFRTHGAKGQHAKAASGLQAMLLGIQEAQGARTAAA